MMHNPGTGTFAPYFPNVDEAEEFSNAMRQQQDRMRGILGRGFRERKNGRR
jgi:hypothetical protein